MSSQTDQLLLHAAQMDNEQLNELQELKGQILDARERLRTFEALATYPPFQVFLKTIDTAKSIEQSNMEKTDNPTMLAKFSGAFCALSRLYQYVDVEVAELKKFLNQYKHLSI